MTDHVRDYEPAIYKRGQECEILHGSKRVRAKVVRVKKGPTAVDYVYVLELVPKPQKWSSWTAAKRHAKRRRIVLRGHALFPLSSEES